MMSENIVTRLRGAAAEQYGCNCVKCEAADEIERLRRQVCRMSDERTEMLTELRQRVETLTAERDEARREVSYLRPSVCLGAQTANEYARERGWDCFKEER
jgi:nitrate/nitrite-specific signal transduction histidine kinase